MMRKAKRLLGMLLAMTLFFTMSMGMTSYAMGVDGEEATVAASSTIVGPDGNIYTYLGTATRSGAINNPVSVTLGTTVTASDGYKIAFYCPNNNRLDLVQGTVTANPVTSGSTQTFSFLNYFNEVSTINLSSLSGTGYYSLSINVYAIGTSNKGDVYFRLYQ